MITSMTGYGKSQTVLPSKEISVEIKSVNHRYLDLNVKAPRYLGFVEDRLRGMISKYIQRGKVDIYINISSGEESGKKVLVDRELAQEYVRAFQELSECTGIANDISTSIFLGSEVFQIEHPQQEEEELWQELEPVIVDCLDGYTVMRRREGERLKNDILAKTDGILKKIGQMEAIIPENIENYKARLLNKIKESVGDMEIDESRILTEVAIYTDKTCVDEEVVRLKSHVSELIHIFEQGGTVGKKLDFLIQEMNREINTIGSKANELKISQLVIDIKTEIEKIREQIQNIE